jgi:uncharacterized membrane protein (DUF2068 family)
MQNKSDNSSEHLSLASQDSSTAEQHGDAILLESHNTQLLTPSVMGQSRGTLLTIAVFELIKGVAALAASLGVLSLAHSDVVGLANALIGHYHLDPDAHYPQLLIQAADWVASSNLYNILALGVCYAAVRLIEAYGLWRDRVWAEWLAALGGALYLPFELMHLIKHVTVTNSLVLIANLAVVGFMVFRLKARRHEAEF